jgi:hypothetical protein
MSSPSCLIILSPYKESHNLGTEIKFLVVIGFYYMWCKIKVRTTQMYVPQNDIRTHNLSVMIILNQGKMDRILDFIRKD